MKSWMPNKWYIFIKLTRAVMLTAKTTLKLLSSKNILSFFCEIV